ncbi:type II and III secretion system protein family protein [Granulicella aggregans]|jgi:pilus assembly protein CpaC|uniref:type II and III secretion system protein family protein n=1 Tax=Granulicella aggregans TaxID=474949 RepID=UPI0021E045DA|nr:pilus assembly protein N-terminal domain-containing protein [Granulicella aggregans]
MNLTLLSSRSCQQILKSLAILLAMVVAFCSAAGQSRAQAPAKPTELASATTPSSIAAFSERSTSGDALHVIVGHTMFLDTAERVKRVYVANPAVVDSYTASPHQIVVTAKAPGIGSVVLWDEMGNSRAYLFSSDVDVEDLATSLNRALPLEDVHVHSRESHVVLTGTVSTDAKAEAAVKLASMYSKDVSNGIVVNRALVKQVTLKVRVVEVDRSKANQFAFNFFSQGGSLISNTTTQQFQSNPTVTPPSGTTNVTTLTVANALNFLLFSTKLNVGATLQDLESKQVLQILAEPSITTLSGEKANFLAGGEFPFPVVQGSSTGATTITIQFRSYGVKLEFTPVVNADGTIELKVAPEVSALDYTNAVTISGYTIPAISTRRADTQVTLNSGQSFAISGLLDRRTTDLYSLTPGIGNVPVLGQLFRSKSVTHSVGELIVIVTPEVVNPLKGADPLPPEPKPVIPFLAPDKFDHTLPKSADAPAGNR